MDLIFVLIIKMLAVVAGLVLLLKYGGGFGYSIVVAFFSLLAYATKESSLFSDYKGIKNHKNPLYVKGCYRETGKKKRKHPYWSDFKLIYRIQIFGCIQAAICLVYGILTIFIRRCRIMEFIMAYMTSALFLISSAVQSYYEEILKNALKKPGEIKENGIKNIKKKWQNKKEKNIWKPFKRRSEWENTIPISVETDYHTFKDLENKVSHSLNKSRYKLFRQYFMGNGKNCTLFYKEMEREIHIFLFLEERENRNDEDIEALAWRAFVTKEDAVSTFVQVMREQDSEREIDKILKEFFLKQFGTVRMSKNVFLIRMICEETSKPYQGNVMRSIRQSWRQYWIEARLSFDTGILYISRQKKRYGKEQYEKIKKELIELLDTQAEYKS